MKARKAFYIPKRICLTWLGTVFSSKTSPETPALVLEDFDICTLPQTELNQHPHKQIFTLSPLVFLQTWTHTPLPNFPLFCAQPSYKILNFDMLGFRFDIDRSSEALADQLPLMLKDSDA